MNQRYNNQVVDVRSYYTVADIRRIFRCGRDKAYQIVNIRGFPKMVVGNQILIQPDALQKWIDKNSTSTFSL